MLDLEERDGVAIMRLQHGKVNALDLELLPAITEAMHALDQARAVVITGSGSAFSAGVDLQRIVAGGPSYVREYLPAGPPWATWCSPPPCSIRHRRSR